MSKYTISIEIPPWLPVEEYNIKRPRTTQVRFDNADEWKAYINDELHATSQEIHKKRSAWYKQDVIKAYMDLYHARMNFYNRRFHKSETPPEVA